MNKYTDLKVVAYIFQAMGLVTLVLFLLLLASAPDVRFVILGLISFITWYAIGGALLVLIDIAKSVRASAVVAIEQEDRRKVKAKLGADGKSLGLRRINPEKRRGA